MPAQRLSKTKRALVIAALAEGTPINAICRMFQCGDKTVQRIIEETGEALAVYMHENFRDLPCTRIEMDEQWQYVGVHGQRTEERTEGKGDFWLWCAIDPDTKLVFSYRVDRRTWHASECFVEDVASRVKGPVQIATDNHRSYAGHIRTFFGYEGYSYGTETKVFVDPENPTAWQQRRKNGVPQVAKATREAVIGVPDMATLTTAHIERVFLSVRQELARFTRCTLAYSKSLRMHKMAVNLHFGIYNLNRRHTSLDGQTPAQAAGLVENRMSYEQIVELTDAYWEPKLAEKKALRAQMRRAIEDTVFLKAMEEAGL